jgi:prepilin-type N-terminal cleavage/methylation domain-containing protein
VSRSVKATAVKSRGFTLIEILVAIVILSVALLGLASLMVSTTRNNSFGMQIAEAVNLAQNKIEELGVTKWEDMLAGTDPPTKGSTEIEYTRSWTFQLDGTGQNRSVIVKITWNDRGPHSISIPSSIYNPIY